MKLKNPNLKKIIYPLLLSVCFVLHTQIQANGSIRTELNGGLEANSYIQQGTLVTWTDGWNSAALGFTVNFFGTSTNSLFVSPLGYVSTSSGIYWENIDYVANNTLPLIAGFKTLLDPGGGTPTRYGTGIIEGKKALIVDFNNTASIFNSSGTSNFQLNIIDRSDISPGDFDAEFNYQSINYSSFNGTGAFIGFASGLGDNHAWKLPGSNENGKFINSGTTPIINYRNTETDRALKSRIIIESRNGRCITPNYTTAAYVLPTTITLNITAANTATRFSLGANSITTKNLRIQAPYIPQALESFTYRLVNFGTGQFQNITLPALNNGASWDLNELYTKGTFKVIKSPDRSTLFNPYVWLDASDAGTISLNGATVSKWMDKSGNNRNLTQTSTLFQPTYVTNVLNSKPVLRFDGNDFLNFSTQLFPGNSARTIIAVIKKDSNLAMPIYSDSTGGAQRFDFRTNGLGDSASTTIPFSTDIGSTSQYRVAIVTIGTGENLGKTQAFHKGFKRNRTDLSAGTLNTSTSGVSGIGRNSDTTSFFSGDIAEVLIYNRKLTPWQIDNITQYYRNKYALTGAETIILPQHF